MPAKYRKNKVKPRGVSNRNRGLDWIRANATEGVIFFADDDNSYDVLIFEQVSWPHFLPLNDCIINLPCSPPDAADEENINVSRRSGDELWRKFAHCSARIDRRLLRWMDRRPKVSC